MNTPYRSEIPVLEAKKESLERELDDLHARRDATRHALALARQVEHELAVALQAVTPPEPTPLLDRVRVAKPCPVKWTSMQGDDVTRFCGSCRKSVHNVSAMTRGEAEAFLMARHGAVEAPCITYYRRLDGTLVSADCPASEGKTQRKKLLVFATVAAAAAALASSSVQERLLGEHVVQTAGDMAPDP